MANVFLLGGAGFIGSNLAGKLVARGIHVAIGARDTAKLPRVAIPTSVPVVHADLADIEGIMSIVEDRRIDTLVHLASSLGPGGDSEALASEQRTVSEPTRILAHRLAARNVRLVYFSSGGTVYGRSQSASRREDDTCSPISPYGLNKLELERSIRELHDSAGLRYLILRPANPYGPGQDLEGGQGLVSVILGKLRQGLPLEVWGSTTAVRDYIYIDDLTEIVAELIDRDIENCVLNIGSGTGHSIEDVIEAVAAVTGRRPSIKVGPARAVDVDRIVLDTRKIEALGIARPRSLEAGIRAYVETPGIFDGRS